MDERGAAEYEQLRRNAINGHHPAISFDAHTETPEPEPRTVQIRDSQLVITLPLPDITKVTDVAMGVVARGWALVTWPTDLFI